MASSAEAPTEFGAEVMEVIRTRLKLEGDGDEVPFHRHEQFWSTDGELLAENCDGGYCDGE